MPRGQSRASTVHEEWQGRADDGLPRFGLDGPDAFFDHASVSPPCFPARRAVREALGRVAANDPGFVRSKSVLSRARTSFAAFVGSRSEQVLPFPNVSAALASFANAFPWRRGDEVLVSPNEFVSNVLPWQRLEAVGVRVRPLPTDRELVDADVLARIMTAKTRVVALSAVHWATGARQDLRALADVIHERDGFLVVDAAQSLGAIRHSQKLDAYDFLCADSYKWMLSFNGSGFADYSKRALETLGSGAGGWLSVDGDPEPERLEKDLPRFRIAAGVERFLGGSPSSLSTLAVAAACDELGSIGTAAIEAKVLANVARVEELARSNGLHVVTPVGPRGPAGIVALEIPKVKATLDRLRRQGIRLESRGGFLRLAPHFYTDEEEFETLASALGSLSRS